MSLKQGFVAHYANQNIISWQDIRLNDDVRLDKIAFSNCMDGEHAALAPLQQACVLGTL